MADPGIFNTRFGDMLVEMSRAVIAQNQAAVQMKIGIEQFRQQTEEQERVLKLQEEKIAMEREIFELDKQKMKAEEALMGAKAERQQLLGVKTGMEIEKIGAETDLLRQKMTMGDPAKTPPESARRELMKLGNEVDTVSFVDQYNVALPDGSPKVPRLTSRDAYMKRLETINDFMSSPSAVMAQVDPESPMAAQAQQMLGEKAAIENMLRDPGFMDFEAKQMREGPRPETVETIARTQGFSPEFLRMMDRPQEPVTGFMEIESLPYNTLTQDTDKDQAWKAVEQGNPKALAQLLRSQFPADLEGRKVWVNQLVGEIKRRGLDPEMYFEPIVDEVMSGR